MMNKIKKIALLTSGGDAPGMNAAIRSVVLACEKLNIDCLGFYHGYNGLINAEYKKLTSDDVQDIIQQGGTLLKSARCPQMHSQTGVLQAVNTLNKVKIDGLIVIGGDGSFAGLLAIKQHWSGSIIGLPGTIDNDLDETDHTIGFSTAVNTAISAVDKIRDTANAFDRVFIVEVMGRHSGHIAFNVGIATAAEKILSFENFHSEKLTEQLNEIIDEINQIKLNKDRSYIIILAENLWPGGVTALSQSLKSMANIESATCVLGHIQRGGSPVAMDRILATKLGVAAVQALVEGKSNIMIGDEAEEIVYVPLPNAIKHEKVVSNKLIELHTLISN